MVASSPQPAAPPLVPVATPSVSPPVEDPLVLPLHRLTVRERVRRIGPLVAYQLDQATDNLVSPNGYPLEGQVGDWVITRENRPIAVVTPAVFADRYESAESDTLTIASPDRTALEQALGFGSTRDSQTLVRTVQTLASLTIGTIEIVFTPQQWATLAHRAGKIGISTEELVVRLNQKFLQDIWTL